VSLVANGCTAYFDNFNAVAIGDETAPDGVSSISAQPGNQSIVLVWTNPNPTTNPDWLWTRVMRKTGAASTHWRDGMCVYEGKLTGYEDTNVVSGTNYSYSVYAGDRSGNWSALVTASATAP
jgi:hypothetical protein